MEPKGNASAETNWKRTVRDRSDIGELADGETRVWLAMLDVKEGDTPI